MNDFFKYMLFGFFVFLCVFSSIRDQIFEESILKREKLTAYFNSIKNNSSTISNEKLDFVKDSLQDIKTRSSLVEFVEISSFSNGLSIRCLMKNNVVRNYHYVDNKLNSKHLNTIYISVKESPNLLDNQFNKMLSFIEFNINLENENVKNKILKGYQKVDNSFDMFYFEALKKGNNLTLKNTTSRAKYVFETSGQDSLYLVNHLLKKYQFNKFQELWREDFFDFEKIYKKSFQNVQKEYETLIDFI